MTAPLVQPGKIPKVRHCLLLMLPTTDPKKDAKVCVTEQRETVRLTVREPDSTIEKKVSLSLAEAHKLSEFLETICYRIENRPSGTP